MPRPDPGTRADPMPELPVVDRLAPPPPMAALSGIIDAATAPGDVVIDLAGRGGWTARAAQIRRRKAVTFESSPLTRLAAEIVLRPPDLRHLDATVAAIGARPFGETSLRLAAAEVFSTRCRRCNRRVVAEELVWRATGEAGAGAEDPSVDAPLRRDLPAPSDPPVPSDPMSRDGPPAARHEEKQRHEHPWLGARPVEVRYRCPACGPRMTAREPATAPADEADRLLAEEAAIDAATAARRRLRARFAVGDLPETLSAELLDLHSPRQLAILFAILEAIEGGLRAPAIDAALRFGLLGALQQASRLLGSGGRPAALRLSGGRLRLPSGVWRERNPWLAFEAGIRLVRGVVQGLEASDPGAPPARFGEDLRALLDGPASVVVRLETPDALLAFGAEVAAEIAETRRPERRSRLRLAIVESPPPPSPERLLADYHATAWVLGPSALAQLPLEALSTGLPEGAVGWQLVALRRSLEAAAGLLGPEGRVVVLARGFGLEPLVGAALAAGRAGCRLVGVRRVPEPDSCWLVEVDPRGPVAGALVRGRRGPVVGSGGATTEVAAGPELGSPSDEVGAFPTREAFRTVVDAAVATLKTLGEPAGRERLVGPLLIALDRGGYLRGVPVGEPPGSVPAPSGPVPAPSGSVPAPSGSVPAPPGSVPAPPGSVPAPPGPVPAPPGPVPAPPGSVPAPPGAPVSSPEEGAAAQGPTPTTRRATHAPTGTGPAGRIPFRTGPSSSVEAIVELLETTVGSGDGRRLLAVEDELWLADPADRAAAADPISDRIEWAVVTTLATSGPIEPERVVDVVEARLGLDHPLDRALLRACLESYAVPTGDGRLVVAREDVVRRSQEHSRVLARLVELGHALGFTVWLPPRERTRRLGGASLEALLTERERHARLGALVSAPASALEGLDAVWYVRGRATFLFEVEWTAMLGLPVLRRGPQIPTDERTVRFLVLAPERRELVRAKLARSAFLRATLAADNWHVLLWNHLEAFAGLVQPTLAALEPFLGLDAQVERLGGDQLGLFDGGPSEGGPG